MYLRIALLWLIIVFFYGIYCMNPFESADSSNFYDPEQIYKLTPQEDEEAELIALFLSGEIVAPQALYNRVHNDLAAIRSQYGNEFPSIRQISFRPPWVPGSIIIGFNKSTAEKIKNGEYHAWDELNNKYQVTEMDTIYFLSGSAAVAIHCKGRLHPLRLMEVYRNLPGKTYIEPNGYVGDSPNIYSRQTQNGITYLFRHGWGDCPSGCIYSEYWYFSFDGENPQFIGNWKPHESSTQPPWWDDAKKNRDLYYKSW